MSDFMGDLMRFVSVVEDRQERVHNETTKELRRSLVRGSEITSAPGQPVDTSFLRGSFVTKRKKLLSETTTNASYAPAIESGEGPHGPMTLRSEVGGFHSLKLTVAGYHRIVRKVLRGLHQ